MTSAGQRSTFKVWDLKGSYLQGRMHQLPISVMSGANKKSPAKATTTTERKRSANWTTAPKKPDLKVFAWILLGSISSVWTEEVCPQLRETFFVELSLFFIILLHIWAIFPISTHYGCYLNIFWKKIQVFSVFMILLSSLNCTFSFATKLDRKFPSKWPCFCLILNYKIGN